MKDVPTGGTAGVPEGGIAGRTTSLVLPEEKHLPLLAEWFADPEFVRHWGGRPLSREEVAAKYLGRRRPTVVSLLVLHEAEPVGYAQYIPAGPGEGGIDMVLLPRAQGCGYGPDAARALVRHLRTVLGWRRVTVDPEASNGRAVRAWEKAGFRAVAREGDTLLMEWTEAVPRTPPHAPRSGEGRTHPPPSASAGERYR